MLFAPKLAWTILHMILSINDEFFFFIMNLPKFKIQIVSVVKFLKASKYTG